jgi:hypothetical protein
LQKEEQRRKKKNFREQLKNIRHKLSKLNREAGERKKKIKLGTNFVYSLARR